MTGGQTSIPVPASPRTGPCAWCGVETSQTITLEQLWTSSRGKRIPKSTKWAWVCPTHNASLGRREGAKT